MFAGAFVGRRHVTCREHERLPDAQARNEMRVLFVVLVDHNLDGLAVHANQEALDIPFRPVDDLSEAADEFDGVHVAVFRGVKGIRYPGSN